MSSAGQPATTASPEHAIQPPGDCQACPRLAQFRAANRAAHPAFHNDPVASFGPLTAPLLVVGLAPGLKGANRTGRPFTGDYAGEVLYPALTAHGFCRGAYGAHPGDELEPVAVRVTNALRCVPPENKPSGAELAACRGFLTAELRAMPDLRVVLALGGVAHKAVLAAAGLKQSAVPFRHGQQTRLPDGTVLADCYHCSRYNMNTGRLTPAMVDTVLANLAGLTGAA